MYVHLSDSLFYSIIIFCEISWLLVIYANTQIFLIDCISRMVFIFAFIAQLCEALQHTPASFEVYF